MKEIKVTIKLYRYDELNETAKEKAYNQHEEFICSCPPDYENEKGEMIMEDFNTLTEKEFKDYVEESIRINEYWFFSDGSLANTITYTGKHEQAGKIELNCLGTLYEVQE